jgi:hypothetical protein
MEPDLELWPGALEGWSAIAAGGCEARVLREGGALRFDFQLAGADAWAIARRDAAIALPPHYVVRLRLRGDAPPGQLQVKLVEATGANVWWWRREGFAPSREGALLTFHRASLAFAWGPRSGGDPDRIGAVEIAVAAAEGAGSLLVDELRIEPRARPAGRPRVHVLRASSGPDPSFELDFGARTEWGGLAVDFAGAGELPEARLFASDDGAAWRRIDAAARAGGRRLWLGAGEVESRFARLELGGGAAGGVVRVEPVPIELAVAPVRHAEALARAAPRGRYPRHLLGEHADWAVVGGDGEGRTALLGADGALEVAAERFSLEPFLWTGERLHGWADAAATPSLAEGSLPIPSVAWEVAGLRLVVTAFRAAGALVARYEVENPSAAPRDARLVLALRPFQVTPAWQSLGLAAAVAPITRLERRGVRIRVNGAHEVCAVTRPDAFGAALSEEGLAAAFEGRALPHEAIEDPLGFAEGALGWALHLPPGGGEAIVVATALGDETPALPAGLARADAARWAAEQLAQTAARWRARLGALPIALPPAAAAFEESLRASLAWILVNRDGPRIQPGPRAYRRSWIRDGALTATALAELGFADEARAFLRWYAPHQHADGRVPCAVGPRGVDAAVEHDSHGQLAWAIVEVFRLSGDRAFLRELWPHVARAAEAIARLLEPESGLLPASISHEGYASRPVHSYWDDFFALCGLAAAADGAAALADADAAARFAAVRDALARSLAASLARTMAQHGIDVLPGSVELGDFDPTSSAIAFDPCGARALLPPGAAERTFARWWEERTARPPSASYSPYEMRNAVALLQLGGKERALALLADGIADQRPPGWRQWPEVAHGDRRAPRFLGDLPHGWVAAGFLRSVRRLFAYERAEDGALVLAAGVPEAWLAAPGVGIRGLPTHFGPLDLALVASGEGEVRVSVGGGVTDPPGGIVLVSPLARPIREVVVGGRTRATLDPRSVRLDGAAEVVLRYV